MEKNEKKRLTLSIGGTSLTIVTDQDEETVYHTADELDSMIRSLRKNNFTVSLSDAAILCALESTGEKIAAEKKIRSLEAQVALCEMSMRSMRDEISSLKKEDPESDKEDPAGLVDSLGLTGSTPEEKISALEKYLENKRLSEGKSSLGKEGRIKYIESLLRGGISRDD